jgi:hypothetical protein
MADAPADAHSEESHGGANSPPLPPDGLIIVPVRGMVLFPRTVLPLGHGGPESGEGAEAGRRLNAAQR